MRSWASSLACRTASAAASKPSSSLAAAALTPSRRVASCERAACRVKQECQTVLRSSRQPLPVRARRTALAGICRL